MTPKIDDIGGPKKKKRKSPGNQMKDHNKVNHLEALAPIPESAKDNPIGWAGEHFDTLLPRAAKEVEWAQMFGDNKTRLEVSFKLLAMKGLSDRGPQIGQQVPAIQVFMNNATLPWSQSNVVTPRIMMIEGQIIDSNKDKE